MKRRFSASLWREGDWIVAQCLELDVASQGRSEVEAVANLKEALELQLQEPRASTTPSVWPPRIRTVPVESSCGHLDMAGFVARAPAIGVAVFAPLIGEYCLE